MLGDGGQRVEYLLSMQEAMALIPSPTGRLVMKMSVIKSSRISFTKQMA